MLLYSLQCLDNPANQNHKINQVVCCFNIGLSQEISYWSIIQICIVLQAQIHVVPNVYQQMYLKTLLTCVLKNSISLLQTIDKSMIVCKLCSEYYFSSQLLNLFITGGDILFCKNRVSWQCCLVKLVDYLNCGSVQVFCNNRSGISSLIHRNIMILQLISSYLHEPMCIS